MVRGRGGVRARALIDAFLPRPDVRATTDPVIRSLLACRGRCLKLLPQSRLLSEASHSQGEP